VSNRQRIRRRSRRLAFYLDNFEGGGVQKTTLTLAGALAARGYPVELLVCRPSGVLQNELPPEVEVVALAEPSAWSARMLALKSDPAHLVPVLGGIVLSSRASPTLGYLKSLSAALKGRRP
jgi:hypothetical protein